MIRDVSSFCWTHVPAHTNLHLPNCLHLCLGLDFITPTGVSLVSHLPTSVELYLPSTLRPGLTSDRLWSFSSGFVERDR